MEKRYLDYEIMTLSIDLLQNEIMNVISTDYIDDDYLNEIFTYGCWGDMGKVLNSKKSNIEKAINLLHGRNSVIKAIENDCSVNVIKKMLYAGINPNVKNNGYTALMVALNKKRIDIIKELLSHPDIDPNLQNRDGMTPLMNAVTNRDSQAVQELLKHPKIDPNIGQDFLRNGCIWTPIVDAITSYRDTELLTLLNHPKIDPNLDNPIFWAITHGNLFALKQLVKHPKTVFTLKNNDDWYNILNSIGYLVIDSETNKFSFLNVITEFISKKSNKSDIKKFIKVGETFLHDREILFESDDWCYEIVLEYNKKDDVIATLHTFISKLKKIVE